MRLKLLALATLAGTTAFSAFGPPWISIETPANPYDSASRGAFLLVHAFHHGTPVSFPVSGTAEGIVKGERRTISLALRPTSRPGVYALHKQWSDDGIWTLVLSVTQGTGDGNTASAVVELGATGQVASIQVPTVVRGGYRVPAPVSMASIDAGLRARAGSLAAR